jgi:four helix bundle protein
MATEQKIKSFKDLLVWRRGMDLTVSIYALTRQLPENEKYGLSSQLRRASVSIPANIAEGHGRELPGAFVQHLRIAQGSLKELETLVHLTERLSLAEADDCQALLRDTDELGRMLRGLIRSIQQPE